MTPSGTGITPPSTPTTTPTTTPATTPTTTPAANPSAQPALMVAVPSDPASAAAFAAGNLFVFLCTPAGQTIAVQAQNVGSSIADVLKGLAQDVINIFRGIHI